jgi:hypothetical protein
MLYEITAAVPHPDYTVTVTWTDGARGVVSLEPFLARGELFAALKDLEYFVSEMRILRGGVGLTWPNEVDFSADGLRHDAFPEERFGEYDYSVSPNDDTRQPSQHPVP